MNGLTIKPFGIQTLLMTKVNGKGNQVGKCSFRIISDLSDPWAVIKSVCEWFQHKKIWHTDNQAVLKLLDSLVDQKFLKGLENKFKPFKPFSPYPSKLKSLKKLLSPG